MKEGAVVLLSLPQTDGKFKPRHAVALREMPGFGDWVVCGISTQLHQCVAGFDEIITSGDPDFTSSRLVQSSVIRLGFLQVSPDSQYHGAHRLDLG